MRCDVWILLVIFPVLDFMDRSRALLQRIAVLLNDYIVFAGDCVTTILSVNVDWTVYFYDIYGPRIAVFIENVSRRFSTFCLSVF